MEKALRWAQLVALLVLIVAAGYAAAYLLVRIALAGQPEGAKLSVKDCMDVAQVAITGLGLGSLVLLWKQLRDASKWNKLLSYHQFFSIFPSEHVVSAVRDSLRQHQEDHILRDKDATLSSSVAQKLYSGNEPDGSRASIDGYLDMFETFCAAVHCGLISEDYAYGIEGGRVIKNYLRFEEYIKLAQEVNKRAFTHFKVCAHRWKSRRQDEDEKASRGNVVRSRAPY